MADTESTGRYVPFPGLQGWLFAAFICLLTAGLYIGAYLIHHATYRDPRLPTTIPSQTWGSRDAQADR